MINALTHALVRPPGDSYINAISSRQMPIDVPLARAQHREYCQAIAEAGLAVETLPPDERFPDSCFMQDPAMVIRGQAVIARPGAPSRSGEEAAVAAWLEPRFPMARITAPGTLEGGDVLVLPGRTLVGQSGRTNGAGIDQLVKIMERRGVQVLPMPVMGYLHLLTAVSFLGQNMLLAMADLADYPALAGFDVIVVPEEEAYAANVLAMGESVIMPAGCPRVAEMLRARGLTVLPVPLSQFEAADGGATCLSLVWKID
jgi:dimethylargininase